MGISFDNPASLAINSARLDHLASLGLALNHRTVLEPGSGIGLLTGFWEDRQCRVTSLELQSENVKENSKRHPSRNGIICRGVEAGFLDLGQFDIVFCYGLLYHVRNPEKCLEDMSAVSKELLLLETMVHPVDDGKLHLHQQRLGRDQGMPGPSYRPARNWITGVLSRLFPFVYVSRDQPNHHDFPTKWPGRPDIVCRSIFVSSRKELKMDTIISGLPKSQKRINPK